MKTKIVFVFLVLTSCAYTPDDVLQQGKVTIGNSKLAPAALAECFISNTENLFGGFFGRSKLPTQEGDIEVVMGNAARTVGIAQIKKVNLGSSYTLHMADYLGSDTIRERITKGCVAETAF